MKIKSVSELTDFYYDHLSDAIDTLEDERRSIVRTYIAINVVAALVALPALIWGVKHLHGDIGGAMWSIGGVLAVWAWIVSFLYKWITEKYSAAFKARVIRPLIDAIAPGKLHYYPANSVSLYQFQRSRLFAGKIDKFEGADLVKGEINGVFFQFSSVHAYRQVRQRAPGFGLRTANNPDALLQAAARDRWSTLFQGFFMVAEFGKHFEGTTLILPDADDPNVFGFLDGVDTPKPWLSRDRRVKMDSPLFEGTFNVYSTDPIEAHYLLTHSMMERIMQLKQLVGARPMYLSFNGGHLYIAIANDDDELFRPAVFRSAKAFKIALDYITTIRNSVAIVEILQINLRNWTKKEGERSGVERFLHEYDAELSPKRPPK